MYRSGRVLPEEDAAMPLTADSDIKALLENARTIALVGASDRPDRPSYGVMARMQAHARATGGTVDSMHVDGPVPYQVVVASG